MRKIIFCLILFLSAACKLHLKTSKLAVLNNPTSINCYFPFSVNSDSLFNFALKTFYNVTAQQSFHSDSIIVANYFNTNPKHMQDSSIKVCQSFLLNKLGEHLYCNNLYLTPDCFRINRDNKSKRAIRFYFLLPNTVSKKINQWTGKQLENTQFDFEFDFTDNKAKIYYPENVPECNGLADCGFIINKDSAITLLKKNNYINDSIIDSGDFSLENNGNVWEYKHADKNTGILTVKINRQSGVISKSLSYFEDIIVR